MVIGGFLGIAVRQTTGSSLDDYVATKLPNAPASKRTAIANAATSAAIGQSFSAPSVIDLLASAAYFFSFDLGSVFTSSDASTLATTNGDAIGCAKDWIVNQSINQSTPSARGVLSAGGVTFDGNTQNLMGAFYTQTQEPDDWTGIVCARPLRLTTTKGGAFVKAGDDNGWAIGAGEDTFDTTTSSNQMFLAENKSWMPTSQNISTSMAVHTLVHYKGKYGSYFGNFTGFYGSTQTMTKIIGSDTDNNFYVGGYSSRKINCEVASVAIFYTTLSTTERTQINRYLSSYYGF